MLVALHINRSIAHPHAGTKVACALDDALVRVILYTMLIVISRHDTFSIDFFNE